MVLFETTYGLPIRASTSLVLLFDPYVPASLAVYFLRALVGPDDETDNSALLTGDELSGAVKRVSLEREVAEGPETRSLGVCR